MQTFIIWLGIGMLVLTACTGPQTSPREGDTSQSLQTASAPVQATSSVIAPLSPLLTSTPITGPLSPVLPSPTSPVSETPIRSVPPTDEAVLIYHRSGGLANISEAWSVYPNGRVVAGNGREWQVSPEQIEQLLRQIETLGFFELKDSYKPGNSCCDRFTHQLTVRRADKVHTITTIDAAPNAPAEVGAILTEVHNFFTNLR